MRRRIAVVETSYDRSKYEAGTFCSTRSCRRQIFGKCERLARSQRVLRVTIARCGGWLLKCFGCIRATFTGSIRSSKQASVPRSPSVRIGMRGCQHGGASASSCALSLTTVHQGSFGQHGNRQTINTNMASARPRRTIRVRLNIIKRLAPILVSAHHPSGDGERALREAAPDVPGPHFRLAQRRNARRAGACESRWAN